MINVIKVRYCENIIREVKQGPLDTVQRWHK